MANYVEILQHPTLADRLLIKTNALAPIKNYISLNPLKSQIVDYRLCYNPPKCIEVIMSANINYLICALPVFEPTMLGVYPVEKVNGVSITTNEELLTQLETLLLP